MCWVWLCICLFQDVKKLSLLIRIITIVEEEFPKKNNLFFFFSPLNIIDHERIALGNEEGLFVVHVTKDGKRLETGNNFPNSK